MRKPRQGDELSDRALEDLTIIDMSEGVAGPYAAKLFADYGADVIKIEMPGTGDPARRLAPLYDDAPPPEQSGMFAYLNQNKRSVALDPSDRDDEQQIVDLIASADVVIESASPGERSGTKLDYETLVTSQNDLIMTSLTWFGQSGPFRDYNGSDPVIHALSAVTQSIGTEEGPPLTPTGYQSQFTAGNTAYVGTMGALFGRDAGLGGQHVDVSIYEANLCLSEPGAVAASYYPDAPSRLPRLGINRFRPTYPAGIYPCKDGWIGITTLTPQQWGSFCQLIGKPELSQEEKYQTAPQRLQHADELDSIFQPALLAKTSEEWAIEGQAARIPFAMVPTMEELFDVTQFKVRHSFVDVSHADLPTFKVPQVPFRLFKTPPNVGGTAPRLGEHTEEVLAEKLGASS